MSYSFMGYTQEKLIKLISEHEERKFTASKQWTSTELLKMDQAKINARQKREEFRAALASLNASEIYKNAIMRAYDKVHGIEDEIISLVIKALCSIVIETEVRSGPDYDKKYVFYPSEYGAGCIIEGLRMKGYEITKINQK